MAYSSVKQNRHTIAGEASAIMSKILNAPASCLIEIVSHVSSVAHDDRTILCLSTTMLLVRFSRFFPTPSMMLSVRMFKAGSKK